MQNIFIVLGMQHGRRAKPVYSLRLWRIIILSLHRADATFERGIVDLWLLEVNSINCFATTAAIKGVARIFQRGDHTVSNIIVMAFSPRNIVGCFLKKRLTKGGSRAPQDPLPSLRPWPLSQQPNITI